MKNLSKESSVPRENGRAGPTLGRRLTRSPVPDWSLIQPAGGVGSIEPSTARTCWWDSPAAFAVRVISRADAYRKSATIPSCCHILQKWPPLVGSTHLEFRPTELFRLRHSIRNRFGCRIILTTVILVLQCGFGLHQAHAQEPPPYTVVDLGSLGGFFSAGTAINNRAEVTGSSYLSDDTTLHAFLYSDGNMKDLGTLPNSDRSYGADINDSGEITGSCENTATSSSWRAFLYSRGSMIDLGTLGGTYALGMGINNFGEITGGSEQGPSISRAYHAFLYSGGGMRDLASLNPDPRKGTSEGADVNNVGDVTGRSDGHAILYSGGTMTDLGTLAGAPIGASNYGTRINDARQVVGYGNSAGGAEHAFLYSSGKMQDLGTLPGDTNSRAYGINNTGRVVGWSYGNGYYHAFLYVNGHMYDLNSLIPPNSGWVLIEAHGINDAGQITGYGVHEGAYRAFRLDGDADGDGLSDTWETQGVTVDSSGNVTVGNTGNGEFINLPAMGADPMHKDIFVHADSMAADPNRPGVFFRPDETARQLIIDAFAKAPVDNPDHLPGINIHIDLGPGSVMKPGAVWGNLSRAHTFPYDPAHSVLGDWLATCPVPIYNWADFDSFRSQYFLPSRRSKIFHYVLFCDRVPYSLDYCPERGSDLAGIMGISRTIPGHDFLVALGGAWGTGIPGWDFNSFPPALISGAFASTFMHELGHNLGLRHGGFEDTNLKPNYISVMNDSFLWGVWNSPGSKSADYSRLALPPLAESALNEAAGIGDPSNHLTRWYPEPSDGLCNGTLYNQKLLPGSALDWNMNCAVDTGVLPATDINADGSIGVLLGFDDWHALAFDGNGTIGDLASVQTVQPSSGPADEPTIHQIAGNIPYVSSAEASAPQDVVTVTPEQGSAPLTVTCDGTGSTASVGRTITTWAWDLGDNTTGSGAVITHTYGAPAAYIVRLTVTDSTDAKNITPAAHIVNVTGAPPLVQSAVSRKTHGAGTFDINILSPTAVECRNGGATKDYTVVVTCAAPVSVTGNPQAQVTSGTGTIGSGGVSNGGAVTVNGSDVTIPLTNVGNAQILQIKLNGVDTGTSSSDPVISMRVLVGDTNADGRTNVGDTNQTKSRSGQTLDQLSGNFRSDVNLDGRINVGDTNFVKAHSGSFLP